MNILILLRKASTQLRFPFSEPYLGRPFIVFL